MPYFIKITSLLIAVSVMTNLYAADTDQLLRVGIIGLDTSHAAAFAKQFNAEPADPAMQNCRVVAAYPHGSRTIESSYSRIPKYTEDVKAVGVEIVDSIEDLLAQVDVVLLETNDGKPHLEQAMRVFRAGKPVFIDKPVGANLAEVVAIYRAAAKHGVPMFSSSALRFTEGAQAARSGEIGDVVACDTFSPCSLEPSHTDLFWYGIHGVEPLFTALGTGCQSVTHTGNAGMDVVVGTWSNDRIGTYRGLRAVKSGYGGTAFGSKGSLQVGPYSGYQPLLRQIATFFRTGKPSIETAETLEIYAFMEAAAESKKRGGEAVTLAEVMSAAEKSADELLKSF
ncbi:Oxidoreductase family, NAD-binding Rossmann fold [Stieleria varia]|uniref:Oxidoreductase family, NAD-binding Rossmann fold n=2 Tax=Stieleria varia TaxID=2528005 RepID=A0A5C6B232_9BACT|nr:Oxidoreductase family, NAD-binding Rossmann fold [Stieleria varia]